MKFEFGKTVAEKIYDNHGCPCLSKYKLNFSVDGVYFAAKYADTWRDIDIYFDNEIIKKIDPKQHHHCSPEKIRAEIKNAFQTDETIKSFFHKIKGDSLDVLKEEMCEKLLKSNGWE